MSRTPREAAEARWAVWQAERLKALPPAKPPAPPRNVRAILDLGNMVYFEFKGRAYGVPPLPWREGEKLLALRLQIGAMGKEISEETLPVYYAALKQMTRIMWRNTRPKGRWLRFLKRVRLFDPFAVASELEVAELAVFFLGLRTRSTASFRRGVPEPRTTSSMISRLSSTGSPAGHDETVFR